MNFKKASAILFTTIILLSCFVILYQIPQAKADTSLTLRPAAAGTYQQDSVYGGSASHWQATSDQNDSTGVQATLTSQQETEALTPTTQSGTISSVEVHMKAKATATATFGYTSLGASHGGGPNVIFANKYTLTENGTVTSISVAVYTATGNVKVALYRTDNSLIVQSASVSAVTGWNNISITPTLLSAGDYWLAVDCSAGNYYFTGMGADGSDLNTCTFSNAMCNPINLYSALDGSYARISMYATYTQVVQAEVLLLTNSTLYTGSPTTISDSAFTDYSTTYTTNPNTGTAWTWSDINQLQIGAQPTTLPSGIIQFSEFYLIINYIKLIISFHGIPLTEWKSYQGIPINEYLKINGVNK